MQILVDFVLSASVSVFIWTLLIWPRTLYFPECFIPSDSYTLFASSSGFPKIWGEQFNVGIPFRAVHFKVCLSVFCLSVSLLFLFAKSSYGSLYLVPSAIGQSLFDESWLRHHSFSVTAYHKELFYCYFLFVSLFWDHQCLVFILGPTLTNLWFLGTQAVPGRGFISWSGP